MSPEIIDVIGKIFELHETRGYSPSIGSITEERDDKFVCVLTIDPFYEGSDLARECIARRQLDAIENYLMNDMELAFWESSERHLFAGGYRFTTAHELRVKKIKWCLDLIVKRKLL